MKLHETYIWAYRRYGILRRSWGPILLCLITVFAHLKPYLLPNTAILIDEQTYKPLAQFSQAILIFILYAFLPNARVCHEDSHRSVTASIRQIRQWIRMLFLWWFLLYLGLGIRGLPGVAELLEPSVWVIVEDMLNVASSALFIGLFVILSDETISGEGHRVGPDVATLIIVFVVFAVTEALVLGYFKADHARWVLAAIIFKLFIGVLGGTTMAMVFGRLESRYIDLPRSMIVTLYTYAVIQPLWVVFDLKNMLTLKESQDKIVTTLASAAEYGELGLTIAAMLLKIVLFCAVAWLLSTGVLGFYVSRMRPGGDPAADRAAWLRKTYGS